jgi:DNA-binding NarL/FixJ family response regulator
MSSPIRVFVYAHDPISQAGVSSQLRCRPEIAVVDPADVDAAAVALVVADVFDEATAQVCRALQRNGCPRIVLVATQLDDRAMMDAIEAGVCGLLRRSDATPERLIQSIVVAGRGDGSVPPDMLGRLLEQVSQMQRQLLAPHGLSLRGLAEREVAVLRLVAEGLDTGEIAAKLCYSERTIKNVIHDMTTRLQLRNRAHTVAYAVREGLI